MNTPEITYKMQFSLFKYVDTILDGVEEDGLAALAWSDVQAALAELDSFLPPLSDIAKVVFCYYYTSQVGPFALSIKRMEKELHVPSLYTEQNHAWQELVQWGLLEPVNGGYRMPQNVLDFIDCDRDPATCASMGKNQKYN